MKDDFFVDEFSPEEKEVLRPFCTNLDRSIFGLRNLPEVVKGALFSRYSRTDKSLRRVLLDEFINEPEMGFSEIVGFAKSQGEDQMVATQKAEEFYDRVLVGYGDDSVAELGSAHIAIENVTHVATKFMEDSRIGLDPLEKSTRYVYYDEKVNGKYKFYRPADIMQSEFAKDYEDYLNLLFETYSEWRKPMRKMIKAKFPQDPETTDRAYKSTVKAKVCDSLRPLLPVGTVTNMGFFGNGRAFEYLLLKMFASDFQEVCDIAEVMNKELNKLIPSFVKRANNERGQATQKYLRDTRAKVKELAEKFVSVTNTQNEPQVTLVDYDQDAENKIAADIIFANKEVSLAKAHEIAKKLSGEEKTELLNAYSGARQNRFHRPGRAFEETFYTFEVVADINAFRDIHRHRMLTQERQPYTTAHGFITPPEIIEAGTVDEYKKIMSQAHDLYQKIAPQFPHSAQYLVPMGYLIRWRMKMNLREAYHLLELRSVPQGHPTYRKIAQDMYLAIKKIHPLLAEGIQFVDMSEKDELERLGAEKKIDKKLETVKEKYGN
ncbi:MAG: thymidylate synthase [Candidatus Buchananbacteria bacterium CG10_big_fil_rev_8_21_14_0_10_42_9]|uniref:Thymidylate synthase n=1 Tax=Candidatus Buchananbacteria bacterium CG10_big_fil_rev_8_21_14_0_10_42_9 TaxID=1974526 RepID=A0A2H0W1F4_9BACT|nr:MAG: thymidylate synthase [Candidatus Buchananbacteria bacterium CG10_big_fil_rev_8_21_14_0_10_42_9]